MTLGEILAQYGYPIVFAGAIAEGEVVLALAGFAVHRGHLAAGAVLALAALGGFVGDQAYFALGRRFGTRLAARYPRLAPARARVAAMIDRRPALAVLAVRFLYGLRIAGPIAIGMSRIHWLRFAALNLASAALWSALWVGLGYALGDAVERVAGRIARAEEWALGILAAAAAIAWLVRRRRATRGR
ncbi:MAG: DedA family protein [Burkholderiales bacterium]|nr:DedA family protein [Burkholderiales bacterium]